MEQMTGEANPYQAPREPVRDIAADAAAMPKARRLTRLAAAFLDGLVFIVAGMLVGLMDGNLAESEASLALILMLMAGIGLANLYFLATRGQTLGKMALGIRIVRSDGSAAGLVRLIFLRGLSPLLMGMIPLAGPLLQLVNVLFIFGEPRRCLHDYIADTIVVQAR